MNTPTPLLGKKKRNETGIPRHTARCQLMRTGQITFPDLQGVETRVGDLA